MIIPVRQCRSRLRVITSICCLAWRIWVWMRPSINVQPPAVIMLWISVILNTIALIMHIEPGRINEALDLCRKIFSAGRVTRSEFQNLWANCCTCPDVREQHVSSHPDCWILWELWFSVEAAPLPLAAKEDIVWFLCSSSLLTDALLSVIGLPVRSFVWSQAVPASRVLVCGMS